MLKQDGTVMEPGEGQLGYVGQNEEEAKNTLSNQGLDFHSLPHLPLPECRFR